MPVTEEQTVSIVFVGDREMAEVNSDFVGHEGTTDVITFNYLEGDCEDDDVAVELVICPDVAERVGLRRRDSNYARELTLYMVHGLLHCAGYDDLEPETRRKMRAAERRVMKILTDEFDFTEIFKEEN